MKNYLLVAGMFFVFGYSSVAQELNNYKYIRVPDKFSFLKEENQYRLNELLAFLFEKEDFEALYKEPVPAGVSECEILTADVQNESGLFRSRVFITLSDCKNNTVFTSKVGVSRNKDYRDSYQDALRNAFKSVIALDHQYSEGARDVIVAAVPSEVREQKPQENSGKTEMVVLTNAGKTYLLKVTASGYDLFEKDSEQPLATLTRSGRGDSYLYTSEKINGNAFFDANGNLVVEYLFDGQLVNLLYSIVQ